MPLDFPYQHHTCETKMSDTSDWMVGTADFVARPYHRVYVVLRTRGTGNGLKDKQTMNTEAQMNTGSVYSMQKDVLCKGPISLA